MNKNTVFSAADILLPDYGTDDIRWTGWSVIACDQFTSEPEYWEAAEALKGEISALDLILPEAYLGTQKEAGGKAHIAEAMKTVPPMLKKHADCMILLERTLPDGRIRRGIIGKIDLEEYDFTPGSSSAVRATEETVIERIPPRVAVREVAEVELPHVMIFADDKEHTVFDPAFAVCSELEVLYDFELMLGGGRVKGYKVHGEQLARLMQSISDYEEKHKGGMAYAVGDGNHSLASAKAHYENIKKSLGDGAKDHPARWALAEIVDLCDDSIEFEPIYRLLKNCDPSDVIEKLTDIKQKSEKTVSVITSNGTACAAIPDFHPLGVGSLQIFIDEYIKNNPKAECDYIHGTQALENLASENGCVGFVFDGVEKSELFSYVKDHGTLPRKTFSMGEAKSKRYYLEARQIVK